MTISYRYGRNIYLNMTNRCPNSCTFCVRNCRDSLGDADSLWLDEEPTVEETMESLDRYVPGSYDEVVFCGYGEPTERFDDIVKVANLIHERLGKKVRLNTNGLGNLINGRDIIPEMKGVFDSVSISLNAPDAGTYMSLCSPEFGDGSYDSLISFIEGCRDTVGDVTVSVVSGTISQAQEDECERIASRLGVRYRCR